MKEHTPILDSEKYNTLLSSLKHDRKVSKKLSTKDWFLKEQILGPTLWNTAINNGYITPLDLPKDVIFSKFKSNRVEGDVVTPIAILTKLVSSNDKKMATELVKQYPYILKVRDGNRSFFTMFVDNFGISSIKDQLKPDLFDTVIDNRGKTVAEWLAENLPTLATAILPKNKYKDLLLKHNKLLRNSEKLLNMV